MTPRVPVYRETGCARVAAARRLCTLAAFSLSVAACVHPTRGDHADRQPATLSAAAVEDDLHALRAGIEATHPDPASAVDAAQLASAIARFRARPPRSYGPDQAWRLLATLNPLFADAHVQVAFADWRGDTEAHLARGGRLFPFEVDVGDDGKVVVTAALGGGTTPWRGREIAEIDGTAAPEVLAGLMARMPGDTPAFRAALLSRRWWLAYWKTHGAPRDFRLRFAEHTGHARVLDGSREVPAVLQDERSFDRSFRFDLLEPRIALLTVRTFAWEDRERYYAFMHDAFARIKAAGTTTLVIDIRDNGGGDDELWMRGILRYVADKPYRWGSSWRKRIVEAHRDEGETIGDVKTGEIESMVPVEDGEPLAFRGRTYVLIGPYTYSSAVLFANVVKDYGFATLAGSGGAARRGQTGGIQAIRLPGSGLVLVCPRFRLMPPAGDTGQDLLLPDIHLAQDPLDPQAAVRQLLAGIQGS